MLAFFIITAIVTYISIGIYATGRWMVEWKPFSYDSEEQIALVVSPIFWPIILICKGFKKLFELGYSNKQKEIKEEKNRLAIKAERDRETEEALKELG